MNRPAKKRRKRPNNTGCAWFAASAGIQQEREVSGPVLIGAVLLVVSVTIRGLWQHLIRPDIVLRSADWCSVYVLQDVATPILIKVGVTRRQVWRRAGEISRDMTGDRQLRCLMAVWVPYCQAIEAEAHRHLWKSREWTERGTEWFRLRRARDAEVAVLKSSRTVRRIARLRRRWSREADSDTWATDGSEAR